MTAVISLYSPIRIELLVLLPAPSFFSKEKSYSENVPNSFPTKSHFLLNMIYKCPITQFFKHNFLFLYRFHCFTDHQEFNMTLHRNDIYIFSFQILLPKVLAFQEQ